jgi:hypothetical protein
MCLTMKTRLQAIFLCYDSLIPKKQKGTKQI